MPQVRPLLHWMGRNITIDISVEKAKTSSVHRIVL